MTRESSRGSERSSNTSVSNADFSGPSIMKSLSMAWTGSAGQGDDRLSLDTIELEPSTYGMAICSLIRDSFRISTGEPLKKVRRARLSVSFCILLLTLILQAVVLRYVKIYVTASEIHSIRESYSTYEMQIYGEENCTLTTHGHHRGKFDYLAFPGIDEAKIRFNKLGHDDKFDICRIPFSQPVFFMAILFVWTLTCVAELKAAFYEFLKVILDTYTVSSMSKACERYNPDDPNDLTIVGLPCFMKVLLTVIIFVPRVCISCLLLWMGCRFLMGTVDFSNLVLNACALAFLLDLRSYIYLAVTPIRNKLDLERTHIQPITRIPKMHKSGKEICGLMSALWYFLLSAAWVLLYMYKLQDVLPQYKWDVHEVCLEFITKRFAV